MTEAIDNSQFESSSSFVPSIQCTLCLHEILIPSEPTEDTKRDFVECSRCDYHQPLRKSPRGRDIAIFSGSIAAVYFATIVAVLLSR